MSAILADLQKGQGTLGKALKDPVLFDEARQTLAEVHKLVEDVNAGKGTAGKMMKDDQLYQRAVALEEKLTGIVDKIDAGQGTVGQLLTNPQLFDSLNAATGEMHSLMKDMRANPKKFLSIQLHIF